jgi:hypothetical protein
VDAFGLQTMRLTMHGPFTLAQLRRFESKIGVMRLEAR